MVFLHSHLSQVSNINNNKQQYSCVTRNSLMDNQQQLSGIEAAKRAAAFACAAENIQSGMRLGVGSGSTIKYLIQWLKQKCDEGILANIQCVPTSFQVYIFLEKKFFPIKKALIKDFFYKLY